MQKTAELDKMIELETRLKSLTEQFHNLETSFFNLDADSIICDICNGVNKQTFCGAAGCPNKDKQ